MGDYLVIYQLILTGLLILLAIGKAIAFWQKERTPRQFFMFLVFFSLSVLYMVTVFHLPAVWLAISRAGLIISLIGANWFGARAMIQYTKEVEAAAAIPPPPVKTLGSLAKEEKPAAIDATKHEDAKPVMATENPKDPPVEAVSAKEEQHA